MLILFGFLYALLVFVTLSANDSYYFYRTLHNDDLTSFLMILIPVLYFLCVTKSGKIIIGYISLSFKKGYKYSRVELESIIVATKNTLKIVLASGVLSFLVGLFYAISYTTFDDRLWLSLIFRNIETGLKALTYSIVIGFFVFFPVQAWAENKIKLISK